LFPRAVLRQPIRDLSGGERNRVLLAKLLLQGANVLVLDEPTNDLDLETLRVLEEALIAFEGTVLVVSHDRFFLDRIASRVIYLDGQGGCRLHPGDMSSLIEELKQKPKREAREKKDTRNRSAGPRRLTYKEQQELAGLPESIATAETELARLDKALGDPALYEKPDAHVKEVASNRRTAADRVDTLYHRWEELEAIREAQ
ncbi:MAG: ATP-binding cassette domain-containing protein, partial [Planctomycetota bacterium]